VAIVPVPDIAAERSWLGAAGTPSLTSSRSNQPSGESSGSNHVFARTSESNQLATGYPIRLHVPNDPGSTVVFVAVSERQRGMTVPAVEPFSTMAERRAM
jgi:hypothetical protein